ncbi:MAG: hypothetical protein MJB14_17445, partial [Spirochaetes bacterium]|nr:hypothetical protein [Spirochaetota bacterium]
LKATKKNYSAFRLPFFQAGTELSINITSLIQYWQNNPDSNFGLLIDPLNKNDYRYQTTNSAQELTDFGIIEIATTEWFDWKGEVPADFKAEFGQFQKLKNKAYHKIKYIPRLEIQLDN